MPDEVERLLTAGTGVDAAVAALQDAAYAVVSGRGLMMGTALETALKLEETCLRPVRGYSYADLRHGPISVVTSGMTALLVAAPDGPMVEPMVELAGDLAGRGATVVGIGGDAAFAAACAAHVPGPDLPEARRPARRDRPGAADRREPGPRARPGPGQPAGAGQGHRHRPTLVTGSPTPVGPAPPPEGEQHEQGRADPRRTRRRRTTSSRSRPASPACATEVEDPALVDEKALKAAGAHGVVPPANVVQVVVGPEADNLAEDIEDLM